jgi:hypothetical protein
MTGNGRPTLEPMTPRRLRRWALLRTVHDLRISVARRRPITLPNLLRLYRRRITALTLPAPASLAAPTPSGLDRLRRLYRRHQPFATRRVPLGR